MRARLRLRPGHASRSVGRVDRLGHVTTKRTAAAQTPSASPASAARAAAFLASQKITTTLCQQCGTEIAGINDRYSCGVCGWCNHWSEGSTELPPLPDLDDDKA